MLNVIATARKFKKLPSEVICCEDEYTAYCFDEACSYILSRIEQGEEPRFSVRRKSFKDVYKAYT